MAIIYLGLGTNLGNRINNLEKACQYLTQFMQLSARSTMLDNKAQYITDQPDFLNLAVKGETNLSPQELLQLAKKIEGEMGRLPSGRFAPRVIDIDILYYDDWIVETPELVIPHPALQERLFVLQPLAEIAPHFLCPRHQKTIAQLYQEAQRVESSEKLVR